MGFVQYADAEYELTVKMPEAVYTINGKGKVELHQEIDELPIDYIGDPVVKTIAGKSWIQIDCIRGYEMKVEVGTPSPWAIPQHFVTGVSSAEVFEEYEKPFVEMISKKIDVYGNLMAEVMRKFNDVIEEDFVAVQKKTVNRELWEIKEGALIRMFDTDYELFEKIEKFSGEFDLRLTLPGGEESSGPDFMDLKYVGTNQEFDVVVDPEETIVRSPYDSSFHIKFRNDGTTTNVHPSTGYGFNVDTDRLKAVVAAL